MSSSDLDGFAALEANVEAALSLNPRHGWDFDGFHLTPLPCTRIASAALLNVGAYPLMPRKSRTISPGWPLNALQDRSERIGVGLARRTKASVAAAPQGGADARRIRPG